MSNLPADVDLPVEPTDTGLRAFIEQVQLASELSPGKPRCRSGVELSLLQPHPDDCALSIGGLLSQIANPVDVITVYSESASADQSRVRQKEDRRFASLVGAEWRHLAGREGLSNSAPRTDAEVGRVADEVGLLVDGRMILAPAGVGRHVDHLAVHDASCLVDAAAFWEDVAFWSIYGASVEDRVQFSTRAESWLSDYVLLAVDVSGVVRGKAALLACYGSQSAEVWRPIRYAWAAARELGRRGYCERLFVPADRVEDLARMLRLRASEGPALQYGTVAVSTAWATMAEGGP